MQYVFCRSLCLEAPIRTAPQARIRTGLQDVRSLACCGASFRQLLKRKQEAGSTRLSRPVSRNTATGPCFLSHASRDNRNAGRNRHTPRYLPSKAAYVAGALAYRIGIFAGSTAEIGDEKNPGE